MELFNVELEVKVLRSVCDCDNDIQLKLLSKLSPDYFGFTANKNAFTRVQTLCKTGKEIPRSSLLAEDPALDPETQLMFTGPIPLLETNDVDSAIEILENYRMYRILSDMVRTVVGRIDKPDTTTADLLTAISEAETALLKAKTKESDDIMYHIGKDNNSFELMQKILTKEENDLIPTGLDSFDLKSGGWGRTNLVILAGTQGGGKSAMQLQLALNQYRAGYNVCITSLEMNEEEIYTRLYSNVAHIPHSDVRLHKLSLKDKANFSGIWSEFNDIGSQKGNRFTVYAPKSSNLSFSELVFRLKPFGYDVIYVDYINLLSGTDGEDQWRLLANVAKEAKLAAANLNAVIVLLCQLGEGGNLRYSKGIKDHANFVWGWELDEKAKESGLLDIKQLKARGASTFTFTVKPDLEYMTVVDSGSPSSTPQNNKMNKAEQGAKFSKNCKTNSIEKPTKPKEQKEDVIISNDLLQAE